MEVPRPAAPRKHSLTKSFMTIPPKSAQSSTEAPGHSGGTEGAGGAGQGGDKDGGGGAGRVRRTGLPTVYGQYGTVPHFNDDILFDDGTCGRCFVAVFNEDEKVAIGVESVLMACLLFPLQSRFVSTLFTPL